MKHLFRTVYHFVLRRYLLRPVEVRNHSTKKPTASLNGERERNIHYFSVQEEEDEDEEAGGEPRDCVYLFPAFPSTGSWASWGWSNRERCAVSSRQDKGCVAVLRCGRQGVRGASNCLLLLSLQAYWWHFNPAEIRIAPVPMFFMRRLLHSTLSHRGQRRCSTHTVPHNLQQLSRGPNSRALREK